MGEEVAIFWTIERLAGVAAFAFAGTWTPGPNNMMLANSGATFGFRRSLPHILGVALGFAAMAFAVALGLGEAFQASSTLREALRWGGAALLLYLAWRVATAAGPDLDPTPPVDRLGGDGRADASGWAG
ncbi:MAG: LysE family transporter, partial [Pseudomonadota bacterium]